MIAKVLVLLTVGIAAVPMSVDADVILQDTNTTALVVSYHGPVGQSFTATDARVDFAFYFGGLGASPNQDLPLELRILSGDGLEGTQMGSFFFSVTRGFQGFWDVDISSIELHPGEAYTAVLLAPGPWWMVGLNDEFGPYQGGRAYFSTNPGWDFVPGKSDDFTFRVAPVGLNLGPDRDGPYRALVPEPGTLALLTFGLASLGLSRRRKAH